MTKKSRPPQNPRAVILTAIGPEYEAIKKQMDRVENKDIYLKDGTGYSKGYFNDGNRKWEIFFRECGKYNERAAVETQKAISYLNPNVILFVGVAGKLKDVELGDVVVAESVINYEAGKEESSEFLSRPEQFRPTYKILEIAKSVHHNNLWQKRIKIKSKDKKSPKSFIGPLLTGSKVIDSKKVRGKLKKQYSHALAVEMEGGGFFTATYGIPPDDALIIRGISDLSFDKKKKDLKGEQHVAAAHASAFAFEVLAQLYPEKGSIKIVASTDSVVRGNSFSVNISGKPNTRVFLWLKDTNSMSGGHKNQPPIILKEQEGILQDSVNGPFNIGGYQFSEGKGKTIKQNVPLSPSNGTVYYARVILSKFGKRTIKLTTSNETAERLYTIYIERSDPVKKSGSNRSFLMDKVAIKVEKGTVTVVAAGDQSNSLGQEIKLSGTNSETKTVYLFITGPNLSQQGGKLTEPRLGVTDGDASTFITTDVLDDNTWEYKWQTANLNIDAGTYTVYAVATANDKNHLADTQFATVSIIIKKPFRKPFVTATPSQSTIAKGDKFYIRGVAEGQPSLRVAVWIMGKNYVLYTLASVYGDGSFEKEISEGVTSNMDSGQYFVVVQHPMFNEQLDVYPMADAGYPYRYVVGPYPTANSVIFTLEGPGSLQGSDAAEALVVALDNPRVDDTYTKLQFLIEEPSITIAPITENLIGEKFGIHGTTNLAVNDEILVEVVSSSFDPTKKTQSGEFSGATGTVKVQKGIEGFNIWKFPINLLHLKPGKYVVRVTAITIDVNCVSPFTIR